jgi:nicotinate-nucleotide pyrophosphorylase (carboxylating)
MEVDEIIRKALEEDIGSGDVTTDPIVPEDLVSIAKIKSKDDGILCGLMIAKKIFQMHDKDIEFQARFKDGDQIKKGDIIATIRGKARTLLTCERTVLNFIQRLSGIATTAHKYQHIVEPYGVKILDTRKTSPLLRPLEKYAVKVGGGHNHRIGLYDMVLIKDNHIKIAGSIKKAVFLAKQKHPELDIEVECENLDMVKEAIDSDADRIMLDNMDISTMKKAVELIGDSAEIEASGGINMKTVEEVAKTGINFISIGSALTNASKSLDISMDIE